MIDIALISAAIFNRNLKNKDNTLFVISLYEIDTVLANKTALEEELTDNELVERDLLA